MQSIYMISYLSSHHLRRMVTPRLFNCLKCGYNDTTQLLSTLVISLIKKHYPSFAGY